MKKFFAILLALAMTFALSATALAATVTPEVADADKAGTITIKGAQEGTDYNLYRVFDLTYLGSGENISVAYTINEAWESFFATGSPGAGYIVDTNSGSLNPITVNGATKYINITDSNVAAFANDAKAWIDTQTTPPAANYAVTNVGEADVDEDGFTVNVDTLGYYLIYPVGATQQNGNSTGSLCSLTSTTPNGTVNIKAELPTITKTVDEDEVDVGQIVTFTITGKVPNVSGYTTYNYTVHDTMTNCQYVSDFQVKIGTGQNVVTIDAINTDTNVTGIPTAGATSFELNIKMVAFLAAHTAIKPSDPIVITYKAKLTEAALQTHQGKNEVYLEYSNDPKDDTSTEKTPPIDVPLYTCEIKINKVGPDETTPLGGAKFVLYKKVNENNAEKKYYYKWNPPTGTAGETGYTPGHVEWLAEGTNGAIPEGATEVETDANGYAHFDGVASGTYWLHETEAPTGYNLLPNDVEVTVENPDNTETENVSVVTHTEKIKNQSGSELPGTGGIGTKIFYIVGAVLMIGAAVLLIVRKKMSVQD